MYSYHIEEYFYTCTYIKLRRKNRNISPISPPKSDNVNVNYTVTVYKYHSVNTYDIASTVNTVCRYILPTLNVH